MASSAHEPMLTVIIPVFNEAPTIEELLSRVLATSVNKQVVVVDDGSTDGTSNRLACWGERNGVEVLYHEVNRGKGAAIRTGLQHARGRWTIVQDADLEYDPQDYDRLLAPLLTGQAGAVFGSRYLRHSIAARRPRLLMRWGVRLLNSCVRWLYGVRLTDEATCYKVASTDTLRAMNLQCQRFEFCPEVTAKLCRMNVPIREEPVSYLPRDVQAGKKIGWIDGIAAIRELWKWRNWRPETDVTPGYNGGAQEADPEPSGLGRSVR